MASKNGGRSTDDERPEDEPVDELSDEFDDEDDLEDDEDEDDLEDDEDDADELDDLDEEDDLEEDDLDAAPVAAGASRSKEKAGATGASAKAVPRSTKKDAPRPNIFGRFINFVREVVAELQKVIWPTRKELLTYTTVVVVFVAIMMTFVAGLDYGFARLMFFVFGNKTTQ